MVAAMSGKKVAVFGLGKLGATLVGVLAEAGHLVRGYDPARSAVEAVNGSQPLVHEPGLRELLTEHASTILATDDPDNALLGVEVVYIIVPTPSMQNGAFDNSFVRSALEDIGNHLKAYPRHLTIIIASTVMPGSCSEQFIPLIEKCSGLSVGADIGLAYSPEFIALGSIVKDMHFPDLVLIGESDARTGELVTEMAKSIVKNRPEIRRMSLTSAEISKIAINTFVTTKISYANMLSEICEQTPGANIDEVTGAVGADSRVGHRYLKAALGYGGPCFPRDNAALAIAAESRGVRADIARATDAINNRQVERIVTLVNSHSRPGDLVALLGLAYKADTPVTDSSQAIDIANALSNDGRVVIGFDPLVSLAASPATYRFKVTSDENELSLAKVFIVANPSLTLAPTITDNPENIIIDLWGAFNSVRAKVRRPGRPTEEESA